MVTGNVSRAEDGQISGEKSFEEMAMLSRLRWYRISKDEDWEGAARSDKELISDLEDNNGQ